VVIKLLLTIILLTSPLFSASWNLWTLTIIHILLYLCILLLILKKRLILSFYKHTTLPLFVFAFFCFLSIFFSHNIYESKNGFFNIIDYILIFYLAKNADDKTLITPVIISGIILSFYAIYQRIFSTDVLIAYRITSFMLNPNIFACYLVIIICLTLGYIVKNFNKRIFDESLWIKNIFLYIFLSLFLIALFLTRAIAAGLSIIFGFFVLLYLKKFKIKIKHLVAIIAISAVVLIFKSQKMAVFDRTVWWYSAVKMIGANPFTGIGLSAFGDAYHKYKISGLNSIYAHNIYLQIAAEIGILGLLAFIYFLFKVFSEVKTKENIPFFAAISAILFLGMLDYSLLIPANSILFWAMLGYVSRNEEKNNFIIDGNKRTIFKWLSVFVILLGIYLSIIIFLGNREMAIGKYYLDENKIDIAYKRLENSLKFDKLNPQTYIYLSNIYLQLHKKTNYSTYLDESEIELKKALKLQKSNSQIYFDLYSIYHERKELKTALYWLKMARESSPKSAYYEKYYSIFHNEIYKE